MTWEIAFVLFLIAGALVVFAKELLPIEVTAIGMTTVLLVVGLIDVEQALSGLSNPAVVTIGALFVLSHALTKTGLLDVAARQLGDMVGDKQWFGVAIMLVAVSLLSAFLSNTAVVAMFMPLAIQLSRRFRISPSKILLPLSYAAIVGGTLTLVGTSTNLIVNAIAIESGQPPFGMFEFARLGWVYLVLGLAYVLLFARRLLPSRAVISSLTHKYHMGTYLTELRVDEDSPLVGRSAKEVGINQRYDITILAIIREGERYDENIRNIPLQAGDIMIGRGIVDDIMRLREEQGVQLLSDIKLSDEELASADQVLAEGLVTPTSPLIGKTLREIDFRRHYGAFVLAVRHHASIMRTKIAHIPLRVADTLLMLAPRERLNDLRRSEDLIIISEVDAKLVRERLWWVAVLIIPVLVVLVATEVVDILQGAVVAVVVLLLLRVVEMREVYRSVDWSVLFLIAAFVPVGYAMTQTGAASYVATGMTSLAYLFPVEWIPIAALALLYLATAILTQMVSNNATAIILAPVAISMASALQVDARPLLMAVAFASSAAFMTPMSYQTNLMVYGPGSYRFSDYMRFGLAPNVLFWLLGVLLIPRLWPF